MLDAAVARPFAVLSRAGSPASGPDGATDATGTVTGTYLHGLFASGAVRRAVLGWLARRAGRAPRPAWGVAGAGSARWDRLADIVAGALDLKAVGRLVGVSL